MRIFCFRNADYYNATEKHTYTGQLIVFAIHLQNLKKGQGRLPITSIQLIKCLRGYPHLDQMIWIYPAEIL